MPLHWPGYKHLGPLTKKFNEKPVNNIDKAAQVHDKEYGGSGETKDIDEKFLKEIEKNQQEDPIAYGAAYIGIRAKEFLDETVFQGGIDHYLRNQVCLKSFHLKNPLVN